MPKGVISFNIAICFFLVITACYGAEGEILLPLYNQTDAYEPSAAFGEDVFLVVWQSGRIAPGDLRNGLRFNGDIVGCRLTEEGAVIDTQPLGLSIADDLQDSPKVCFGGGIFLVVWQDARNGKDWDIYACRVTAEGHVLDPQGILVSNEKHNQAKPQLAWDGKNFIIVWQDFRYSKWYDVYAARISPQGKVLEPKGIKVAGSDFFSCYAPAVSSLGDDRAFVLWVQHGLPHDQFKIRGAEGRFIDKGVVIKQPAYSPDFKDKNKNGPSGNAQPISIAAGEDIFLAAWKTESSLGRGNAPNDSHLSIFNSEGKRIALSKLSSNGMHDRRIIDPCVSWAGDRFIAVWHEFTRDRKRECPYDTVFWAYISSKGKILGKIHRLAGKFDSPASKATVACNGKRNIFVAYEKHPDVGTTPIKIAGRILVRKQ